MPQLLDRPRTRRPFARADILSRMGETICFSEVEISPPERKEAPAVMALPQAQDEEPERWDGLS